jgi:hypothetical protein
MTCIKCFDPRQVVGVGFDRVGKLQEQTSALSRGGRAPRWKRVPCGRDGLVYVGRPRLRDFG